MNHSGGNGRSRIEVADDLNRSIGRSVVADRQLIRESRLADETVELPPQKVRAVVSSHRDGRFHACVRKAAPVLFLNDCDGRVVSGEERGDGVGVEQFPRAGVVICNANLVGGP